MLQVRNCKIVYCCIISSSSIDVGLSGLLVNNDNAASDQPDSLYGPQVIDAIMRKPGNITMIIKLIVVIIIIF